ALRNDGTVLAWGEFDDVPWGLDGVVAIGAGENHGLAVRTGRQTPLITTQPTNQCGSAGGTVSFHVAAIARASIRYQWQRNGVDLAGATNATLTITNLQLGNAGEYRVVVSNGAGATTSAVAVLEAPAPVILSRSVPEAITLTYSNRVTLGVQAGVVGSCAPGLTYQWHFNGQPIAWQTRTNYSLVAASAIRPQLSGVVPIAIAQDGVYSVTVSNVGWSTNVSWTIHVAGEGAGVWWGESASGGWAYSTNIGDIIALDAGEYHGAAVREDGTVIQWGYEWADVPADLTNAIAVSAGYEHTLALRSDGTLVAWGAQPGYGNSVPTNLAGVKAIDSGWYHNLALKTNGTVVAWGANLYGQATVPSGLSNVTAIAAGAEHNLALKADGTVVGWGLDDVGQASSPAGLSNVVGIAAGGSHSLALKRDGTVTAWGLNTSGQCTVPTGLSNVMAVAAGWAHSAALKNDGTLVCWGSNSDGQTNVPGWLADVKLLTAGGNQTAASVFSPLAQYPVDVSKDLLLIYNTNSVDSVVVKDYYLAHRPLVSGANALGIGCVTNETVTPSEFTNQVTAPISVWLQCNPAKRPQYMILFLGIPSRVNTNNAYGVYDQSSTARSPSVSYQLHTNWAGWRPFITHINMNGTNDCIGYINKLAAFGTSGQVVISASASNYANTNWIVDNVRHCVGYEPSYANSGSKLSVVTNALLDVGVATNMITYLDGLEWREPDGLGGWIYHNQAHITNAPNVAGYISWGFHSSLTSTYASVLQWTGNSGWWIIETIESYNGVRRLYGGNGIFLQWFAPSAFGGNGYSNIPVGGVTHVDEPGAGGVNDGALYFSYWVQGKRFGTCAWASRNTIYFQAVGDPCVKR
ncbi:MAG TPA: immunoglobulin domain-containing protein, partial [Verrucomicrobiae bacterium]